MAQSGVCVAELAEGRQPWAIPWPCIHELLAIVTHPKIYARPTPLAAAIEQVDLEAPTLALLCESGGYWPGLRAMIEAGRVKGPQVHDARITALCMQPWRAGAVVGGPRFRTFPAAQDNESTGRARECEMIGKNGGRGV
jgi:hypothetical protein